MRSGEAITVALPLLSVAVAFIRDFTPLRHQYPELFISVKMVFNRSINA